MRSSTLRWSVVCQSMSRAGGETHLVHEVGAHGLVMCGPGLAGLPPPVVEVVHAILWHLSAPHPQDRRKGAYLHSCGLPIGEGLGETLDGPDGPGIGPGQGPGDECRTGRRGGRELVLPYPRGSPASTFCPHMVSLQDGNVPTTARSRAVARLSSVLRQRN